MFNLSYSFYGWTNKDYEDIFLAPTHMVFQGNKLGYESNSSDF